MVADMGPEAERHHHHQSGHRWVDMVLAVSAVVISVVSLFLAVQHGRVMERMLEVSTWPYVVVDSSNINPDDGSSHVVLSISNKGVGPAKIESLEVFYDGVAQPEIGSLLKAILRPSDPNRHLESVNSTVVDMVLPARERINFVDLNPKSYSPDEYSLIVEALKKMHFRTCYCSVFDECSVFDGRVSRRPV